MSQECRIQFQPYEGSADCVTHGQACVPVCPSLLAEVRRVLEHVDTPPTGVNPLNYTHDEVAAMNVWVIEHYLLAKALIERLGR